MTIELNFLGEGVDPKEWKGKGSASAVTLKKSGGKKTAIETHQDNRIQGSRRCPRDAVNPEFAAPPAVGRAHPR